jgi:hypothetical protein
LFGLEWPKNPGGTWQQPEAVRDEQLIISKTGWSKPEFAKKIRRRQIDFCDPTNIRKQDRRKQIRIIIFHYTIVSMSPLLFNYFLLWEQVTLKGPQLAVFVAEFFLHIPGPQEEELLLFMHL